MEIFNRKKYILFIIILLILFTGFVLMAGPTPEKANFNADIYSFRRITLSLFAERINSLQSQKLVVGSSVI